MSTPTLAQARSYHRQQQRILRRARAAARAAWQRRRRADSVASSVASYQLVAASAAAQQVAGMSSAAPQPMTRPVAWAGWTTQGFPLQDPLEEIAAELEAQAAAEAEAMLFKLDRLVAYEVASAASSAAQAEIVARPEWTNYVRMLNPPSCTRCTVLAGRIYRDLDYFLRHPGCDCVMVPVENWQTAHDEGLVSTFRQAFDAGQVRGLSKADEQAIRDGADPVAIVNAYRGLGAPGVTAAGRVDIFGRKGVAITTDATTKRAAWRKSNPNRPIRLRPEAIYAAADGDRDEALRLLQLYGYIRNDATGQGRSRPGRRDDQTRPPQPPPPEPRPEQGGAGGGLPPGTAPRGAFEEEPDDPQVRAAASALNLQASAVEPTVTPEIIRAAELVGGEVPDDRLATRLKHPTSIGRKLAEAVDEGQPLADAAARINDALRYTIVLPENGHWSLGTEALEHLISLGYELVKDPAGWKTDGGYKGRNATLRINGQLFELQFHTAASLAASYATHAWYEEKRRAGTPPARQAELAELIAAVYRSVPVPADVNLVD